MGRLIQIHDVTNGRAFVAQREFDNDRDIHPWTTSVRRETPQEIKLEILTEDSPHFLVQAATS